MAKAAKERRERQRAREAERAPDGRCALCPTWLNIYNKGPLCGACRDAKRVREIAAALAHTEEAPHG